MSGYVTQAECESAITTNMLLAVFDDNLDGIVDAVPLDAVITRASAHVDSWIAPVYKGPFPIVQVPFPSMIKELTLQYFEAMAYDRRPDLARITNSNDKSDRWARADAMGQRLQSAVLRIPDLTAQPKPSNVGGIVVDDGPRVMTTAADGVTRYGGDF